MGSCVSLSLSPAASSRGPPAPEPELGSRVAKVVDLDGSMAKFEGPIVVTAREALQQAAGDSNKRPRPCFLCSSDELGFEAPPRALAADERLQPGQLYFVLPASALRRPLSGQDMAALAVKATRALAVEAGLATATSTPRRKGGGGGGEAGKQQRRTKTARVAPLGVAPNSSSKEMINRSSEGAAWKHHHHHGGFEYDGERTVGKTRYGVRSARPRRRPAGVQRLSAILEASE